MCAVVLWQTTRINVEYGSSTYELGLGGNLDYCNINRHSIIQNSLGHEKRRTVLDKTSRICYTYSR